MFIKEVIKLIKWVVGNVGVILLQYRVIHKTVIFSVLIRF